MIRYALLTPFIYTSTVLELITFGQHVRALKGYVTLVCYFLPNFFCYRTRVKWTYSYAFSICYLLTRHFQSRLIGQNYGIYNQKTSDLPSQRFTGRYNLPTHNYPIVLFVVQTLRKQAA